MKNDLGKSYFFIFFLDKGKDAADFGLRTCVFFSKGPLQGKNYKKKIKILFKRKVFYLCRRAAAATRRKKCSNVFKVFFLVGLEMEKFLLRNAINA